MAVSVREAKYLLAHPEILLGLAEGKIIECKLKSADAQWEPVDGPSFVDNVEYRVKPEPPRTWFLLLRKDGTTVRTYATKDDAEIGVRYYNDKGASQFMPYRWVEVQEVAEK